MNFNKTVKSGLMLGMVLLCGGIKAMNEYDKNKKLRMPSFDTRITFVVSYLQPLLSQALNTKKTRTVLFRNLEEAELKLVQKIYQLTNNDSNNKDWESESNPTSHIVNLTKKIAPNDSARNFWLSLTPVFGTLTLTSLYSNIKNRGLNDKTGYIWTSLFGAGTALSGLVTKYFDYKKTSLKSKLAKTDEYKEYTQCYQALNNAVLTNDNGERFNDNGSSVLQPDPALSGPLYRDAIEKIKLFREHLNQLTTKTSLFKTEYSEKDNITLAYLIQKNDDRGTYRGGSRSYCLNELKKEYQIP